MNETTGKWREFPVGSTVAYRRLPLRNMFTGTFEIHIGTVLSVDYAPNGYPCTIVSMPTLKPEPFEFAVECLATPDQYEAVPSYWVC